MAETKSKKGLIQRYIDGVVNTLTRPLSRKVELYDSGFKNPPPGDLKRRQALHKREARNNKRKEEMGIGRYFDMPVGNN